MKRVRRKIRDLQQKEAATTPQPCASVPIVESQSQAQELHEEESRPVQMIDRYAGHTVNELSEAIAHTDNLYACVLQILTMLFSREYIVSHSVTGQRVNSSTAAKPKFDDRLYSIFLQVIGSKFLALKKVEITAKVQSIQKKYTLMMKKCQ